MTETGFVPGLSVIAEFRSRVSFQLVDISESTISIRNQWTLRSSPGSTLETQPC
jgi:hypothetical protein